MLSEIGNYYKHNQNIATTLLSTQGKCGLAMLSCYWLRPLSMLKKLSKLKYFSRQNKEAFEYETPKGRYVTTGTFLTVWNKKGKKII